jgi:hypothetical protein
MDIVYFYARTHWDCVVPRGSFTTKLVNNQLSDLPKLTYFKN